MKTIALVTGVGVAIVAAASSSTILLVNDREDDKLASLSLDSTRIVGDAERGEYVAAMGGCVACHTDADNGGKPLAGGLPLETPFGTFYSPNITSDNTAGIGSWSEDEFVTALTLGLSPSGEHYYPAFPYTSYSVMTRQEIVDLKAWIDTIEPVSEPAAEHDLIWPATIRSALVGWKALFFDPMRKIDATDRGEYLVNGPTHCVECHSPRNPLGGLSSRELSGNKRGPDGESVPGISKADLADWTKEDIEFYLEVGMTPSGDFAGGHMADVIEYSTGLLTAEDRSAIADFLLSKADQP